MNEIKLCPFCGEKLYKDKEFYLEIEHKTVIFYKHIKNDCFLSDICVPNYDIEKWNVRKPIENIVEKLEDTKTKRFVTGITSNPYEFGACHAMDIAIEIVKAGENDE